MTPWALENIATISNMVPSKRRWQPVRPSISGPKPMLDSFIFLGGSGATLGLIPAILSLLAADYRQGGKLALPSGIFQINEPILFGLPLS